jgi:transposase
MDEAPALPRTVKALTRIVRERDLTIKAKDFEIEHLRLQVARLRRLKFGQSSERFIGEVEQLTLLGETKASMAAPASPAAAKNEPSSVRKKPVREALPEHLPRETVKQPSPCGCPSCGSQ